MNFTVLFGKELREQLRTYRFLAIVLVFVVFAGLLSPVVAKIAPELFKNLPTGTGQTISIEMPEATAVDAIAQFLKNLTQTGVIVLILVAMGTVAQERERGTVITVLSKPVSRLSFLMAKFAALTLALVVSVILAALACWVYTVVLFGPINVAVFAQVGLLSALYLWTILAVTFLCSTLVKSQIAAGGLAIGVYAVISLLGIVPQLKAYLPAALVEGATKLALGGSADAGRAIVVSLIVVFGCFIAAYLVFERREL